jgi:hypothetical protein
MSKEYPLIRIPTQTARLTLFEVFAFCGLFGGMFFGIAICHPHFGIVGRSIGAVVGSILGFFLGLLPRHFAQEHMFREMQKSTNEQLKTKLELPGWNFYQTLALLNLHLRGEDVQPYLPRVLTLLESDDNFLRLFARDALRLVFTPLAVQMDGLNYDPHASTEDCRNKVVQLREKINSTSKA